MNDKRLNILLVEDNEGDIMLTTEALEESEIKGEITVLKNGKDAINALLPEDGQSALQPDLILLDINLPRKSGHEVLTRIKTDPITKRIPVVMLTTSSSPSDIMKSYDGHANCYITKPVDVSKFNEVIEGLQSFWFHIVTLPT